VTNFNIAEEKYKEAEAKGDLATMIALQSAIKFNGGGECPRVSVERLRNLLLVAPSFLHITRTTAESQQVQRWEVSVHVSSVE